MRNLRTLTEEQFQHIYTDEKFRNQVATAHGCYTSDRVFKHLKTCSYPTEYIVTEEQIELAKIEREKARVQTLEENKNKLLFVGMGMSYEPKFKGDVGNHRIRTVLTNSKGETFFIELIRTNQVGKEEYCYFDFAIKLLPKESFSKTYDHRGLEHGNLYKFTNENILNLINREFDCLFEEVLIDNYNVGNISSKNVQICESPQLEVESIR